MADWRIINRLEGPPDLAQMEAKQAVYETARAKRDELRLQRQSEAAIRRAVQDAQGDPTRAVQRLYAIGEVDAAGKLETHLSELIKKKQDARKVQLDNDAAMGKQFDEVAAMMTPENYGQARAFILSNDPKFEPFLPAQYDPSVQARFRQRLIPALDLIKQEQAKLEHQDLQGYRASTLAQGDTTEARQQAEFEYKKEQDANPIAPQGSDYARFEADFIAAEAAKRGKTPDALSPAERVSIKTAARKQFGQADDRVIIAGGGGGGLSPSMESNVVNRLTSQWTAATKPIRDLEAQSRLMDTGMAAARRGDRAQGAQTVLVTFQKILDPTSVVRESEYDRSAAGQSLKNRVVGYIEQLQAGGAKMQLSELEKFARLAREAVAAHNTGYLSSVKERLGRTADRYKIPRDIVFEDVPIPGTTGSGQPGAGGGPTPTMRYNPLTGKTEPIK